MQPTTRYIKAGHCAKCTKPRISAGRQPAAETGKENPPAGCRQNISKKPSARDDARSFWNMNGSNPRAIPFRHGGSCSKPPLFFPHHAFKKTTNKQLQEILYIFCTRTATAIILGIKRQFFYQLQTSILHTAFAPFNFHIGHAAFGRGFCRRPVNLRQILVAGNT